VGVVAVFFRDPPREVLLVLADQVDAAVGAAAVDDEPLEVGVVLLEDGLDRLLQVLDLFEAGGDRS
jgi:hypothetical protein